MEENKQYICNLFCKALQETRQFDDLEALEYWKDSELDLEIVQAQFIKGAVITINVKCDSGIAMMQDILKQIL